MTTRTVIPSHAAADMRWVTLSSSLCCRHPRDEAGVASHPRPIDSANHVGSVSRRRHRRGSHPWKIPDRRTGARAVRQSGLVVVVTGRREAIAVLEVL